MKKIIITCLAALAAIISVSAANSQEKSSENVIPGVLYLSDCKATIEYNVPNIVSGSLDLKHFEKIYRLIPSEIQLKARMAYNDVIEKAETRSQFTYAGVKVKHTNTTWEFYYKGASLIVRNATQKDLFNIFGDRDY